MINRLHHRAHDFAQRLQQLLARGQFDPADESGVENKVREIIAQVRRSGDAALRKLTADLDNHRVATPADLEIPTAQLKTAHCDLAPNIFQSLRKAARRIKAFHQHEIQKSWQFTDPHGNRLGQRVTPLARVGIYVPGGRAAYPSSVLMNAIPAKLAGVDEVIMAVPTPNGEINPAVLAAAALVGVDRVFRIGGAQAIAALTYGTETIPSVDKIVGPGNQYVTSAKRMVFGKVGIDSIAGPSEVLIICDQHANSHWVAMDLCAQAEHDPQAQAIAITDNRAMLDAVAQSLQAIVPQLPRREIIAQSLANHGALIEAADLAHAADLANQIAPEHLQLMVTKPQPLLAQIRHAGAIFVGAHSAESLGDYCAGPNHVLPTAGAARFSSPLGVADFQKRSSIIHASRDGAAKMAEIAAILARCEGLEAHARSAEYRIAPSRKKSKQ